MITMVAVMIAIAANAQYNQIRMVTPLRLIVIDMVIPQEQTGATRIVSETPQQLILTLMATIRIRLGIPLPSSVAIMKTLPSGHGNL